MAVVYEQIFLLLIFIVIGYVLGMTKKADNKQSKLLSVLGFYIFLPANVFRTFATNFTPEYLSRKYMVVIVGAVFVVVMMLVSIPASKLFTKQKYQQYLYRYSMVSSNYGYVGYALAGGIFGEEVLLGVMMFAVPMSIYTYTVGYCMLTKSKGSLLKLLSPVNIGMLAGAIVGFFGIPIPGIVSNLLTKATGCMGPISMLLTGLVISEYALKDMVTNWRVYVLAVLRLLVIPICVGLIIRLVGVEEALLPALCILAMPCGLNTIVFPKLVGEDCKPGAAMAFVTSILCCVTIPLCLLLFGVTV